VEKVAQVSEIMAFQRATAAEGRVDNATGVPPGAPVGGSPIIVASKLWL
jgi:hypothetical protein